MKMKRIASCFLALALGLSSCALAEQERPIPKFQHNATVHDPSIIKADDGYFYIFGSHMAAARSEDLMNWEMISTNAQAGCTLVENVQEQMKEALTYSRTDTFWAPDVIQLADGKYYMYYCTCEGSQPLSMLGRAVSDRPEGPYVNLGVFLKSGYAGFNASSQPNVVDPCVFFDAEGRLWMVYGSYSGGIFILELDTETGLPLDNGQSTFGKKLLGKNHARIEAPYILYSPETEYYYLFLSFGGLAANDGYNIRVCRSETPDGPYYDSQGNEMTYVGGRAGTFFNDPDYEPYGVKLMGGYVFKALDTDKNKITTAYRSPGHNSAYYDEETGQYFLIFHTRFANSGETFSVRVHQMYMNEDGWPVVSPVRYAGETPEPVDEGLRGGIYKLLLHGHDINTVEHESVVVTLEADGTVTGDLTGTWVCEDGVNVTLTLGDVVYKGIMHTALDASQSNWATCISALDDTGAALWAIRALVQE